MISARQTPKMMLLILTSDGSSGCGFLVVYFEIRGSCVN
jgi:hypothetical protein